MNDLITRTRTAAVASAAVAALLGVPAQAAPAVSVEESASAGFPLVVGGRALQLHLDAEAARLVLQISAEDELRHATVALGEGELVMSPDAATLRTVVDGVMLDVSWERVPDHLAVRAGPLSAGPDGVRYRGGGGEYATATVTLGGGACASEWGSLGRSLEVTSDDARRTDPVGFGEVLRAASCGESTAVIIPPER